MDQKANKIGIFGGYFNPIHNGHLNAMLSIKHEMDLERIKVIPARETPLRQNIEGPSAEQRLKMVELGLHDYQDFLEIDEIELNRDGVSYTIDTLMQLKETLNNENLFLIIGADQFYNFDQWKDYQDIISQVNLVVTTRPGYSLPFTKDEFPEGLKKYIEVFEGKLALLSTGKSIQFVRLKDIDVSASDIRKRLRSGKSVDRFLVPEVEKFIRDENLFDSVNKQIQDYEQFTLSCLKILAEKQAINVQAYDLRLIDKPSAFSIVASASNTRQVVSLSRHLSDSIKDEFGFYPYSVDGREEGRWIVMDYGSLIVHIFYDYVRMEYNLEELWSEGRQLTIDG
ncbi:MAG: nicotinate (nicotinamide) nucleotide adenylyltransferase [Bdellovibrionaceae bacterium]|nr:nicotinate (nicotinamide) nucleotide adenylyltransferase [Pseudobdellovibrionaceae bacterium]